MEESEKRRERLKAMRMEAARAGVHADSGSSGLASGGLSNPLIETESASPTPSQCTTSRFDYYTDPMSAFSKRRDNIAPQVSQGHYNTPPRPMYQGMSPNPAYQTPVYHNPGVNSRGQRIFQVPGPHFNQSSLGSPVGVVSPSNRPQGNPPNAWGGSGGAFNYSTPPNFSRDGKSSNPSFGQGESPYVSYGRGRGQRYNSSSHYDSGRGGSSRGRGWPRGNSMSLGSGPRDRRGAAPHESVSAEQRPDLYYRKEMVEDPWKLLTPIVWKDVHAPESDKSWLPKSISMKKAKVSAEASQKSISQQSLAEYLASFNDSSNDAVDDKQGT